ncbi:MAG: type 1 glutamine amidotransferase [Phaeodactylibacter sp.]|nr:type 1 glutamine amidotransferase [Phaeodactylibacter sp.]
MRLDNKHVAILATDGFEQVELTSPRKALEENGARADIISPKSGKIKGWKHTDWGDEFKVDVTLGDADPNDYDALVLPGGVMNPDALRTDSKALQFVRAFFEKGKPVAAICHGAQTMINAMTVEGRTLTSYPAIRKDLENAGAIWLDKEVVVDQGLVTSRSPADLEAFNKKMVEEIAEGEHKRQKRSVETA